MFPKSLTVLNSRCANKRSCSVLAATSMFGDPCPGTHKYLEAHYQCISAAQTSTTTNRPSPPPWVLNNPSPVFGNGSGFIHPPNGAAAAPPPPRLPTLPGVVGINGNGGLFNAMPPTFTTPGNAAAMPGGRLKGTSSTTTTKHPGSRHEGVPPPPQIHHHHHYTDEAAHHKGVEPTRASSGILPNTITNATSPSNTRILTGVGGAGSDDGTLLTTKSAPSRASATAASVPTGNNASLGGGGTMRTINNINLNAAGMAGTGDETKLFCGPTHARNLFWNMTRVGDVNVQPCPGGAAGIAKWRCVLMKREPDTTYDEYDDDSVVSSTTTTPAPTSGDCVHNSSSCEPPITMAHKVNQRLRNFEPTWHPMTPDLTQCRSLWLNNLEMRVNQRDSSLISIANDLSEVTSSKTLYGGDMLVTTKIIQTMSEKMFHDKETFPDQRQREAIIMELLHGVVKTGSNLLDESQLSSWLDLNQEDQMRVATSLLTGLEYNAFLLADTIIRERNVVQKVKNILLSVRVLETKTIQSSVVFPESEQWPLSSDRIELPRAALIENSEGGLVRIVFAAFDRLESILKPTYDHFDLKSSRSYVRNTAILANDSDINGDMQQRIRILNSKVISASLGKGRHIQLSQPIKLVLKHLKTENVTNPTCVFWNYIDHAWSANGCSLESTNRTHSVCACNHLTNFAILMDVVDEHQHSLFTMFDGNMRIFIYVSIAICVIFIVIALLTLKLFNGVFIKSARTSIYSNIYICLLAIELLFLLGIEQTETSIFCGFITSFLHCAILSGTAWFCYEAFHSYSTLTSDDLLLEVDQTPKVNCYYLLSYGLSLTVVAISLMIDPSSYTQNDYCVLMEENKLFYVSFVAPVLLFFVAAVAYTFLSWVIMCRKSRTALKTKEQTRLANVRFDIRCSFVFLLLLSAVWCSAYFYLRQSKMDEDMASFCGYCFISFNTLLGLYIFVFHCIQNEKIRREYRKYVRQHSWLPKCLRCSKTSISSGIATTGTGGIGLGNGGNGGTLSSNSASTGTHALKKSKLPLSDGDEAQEEEDEQDENGVAITEEAIMGATSDCELNEATQRRTLKSGLIAGTLLPALQHQQQQLQPVVGNHSVHERNLGMTNTMRSTGMASAGHTSPTSSADSTNLIFAQKQQQQQLQQPLQGEAYYHQPDYYSWKQPPPPGSMKAREAPGEYYNNAGSPQQSHEVFYWTQKHNNQNGKKKRGGGSGSGAGTGPDSPSGSLHSRTTAASQVVFYPSYKKTNGGAPKPTQTYPHYAEAPDPNIAANYYHHQQKQLQQQQRHLTARQQQQQQQVSSDEEQPEHAAAHAHLLHLQHQQQRRTAGQQQLPPPPPHMAQYQHEYLAGGGGGGVGLSAQQQRHYRNKHSNCDLSQGIGGGSDAYYNQGSADGGPVYEEILSNRNSDVQHYEMNDFDVDEVYNNSVGTGVFNNMRATVAASGSRYGGSVSGGSVSSRNQPLPQQQRNGRRCTADEDDDNEDDDEDDETAEDMQDNDSVCDESDMDDDSHGLPPQSDERMRRLMALQDKDFQRRFQRQLRKNGVPLDYGAPGTTAPTHEQNGAVFGVSGGVGEGSMRGGYSHKQQAKSPSARVAVNELFGHHKNAGPPLPPANQTPAQKRQQQLQKLSPQSTTSSSSHTSHSTPQHQQQQQARHLSAMLDENNTVRCYLEPLAK
ncbi:latrophilin Cirl [Scaptodrosophila lebanonensis]|uniref:Latrophilin Cirl n=1 Tax=Drosophila lebanonensis TaxID=7225 RepID=A0A6J2U1V5_DROLE|nr:latrophilin Cirl [Scaptodrosophila lebanonensis]XP_030381878.1 latrophilin Cirl [Scaptodrosophila lebanonensis]